MSGIVDRALLVEAVSTLENYGDHHEHCQSRYDGSASWVQGPCSCGYADQLARLVELAHPKPATPAITERPERWTDEQLEYAASARCVCGAGLAYAPDDPGDPSLPFNGPSAWDCSDILTGRAAPRGEPGSVTHDGIRPFAFWEIKSEKQPSADGRTTRPQA